MAEQEPSLAHPGSQEMAVHVRDYDKFIWLMKWGAIVSFVIAMIVVLFVL
jgi:hypothetical protein